MTSRIYLASKSPRRREILAGLGYEICLLAPEASPASAPQTDEERRPGGIGPQLRAENRP